ncbi:hypothetical protein D3C72_1815290 [compost metagenome]
MGHRQCLVVALHRVKPGPFQPVQRLRTLRAAVHQVANAEQAIDGGIETDGRQLCLQTLEMTVNITHGIIASPLVDGKPLNPAQAVLS